MSLYTERFFHTLEKLSKSCYSKIYHDTAGSMSGFSISRLSHRLAIQDRPPREKSQSALNKKQDEEVEGEEKSSLGDVKSQQPALLSMTDLVLEVKDDNAPQSTDPTGQVPGNNSPPPNNGQQAPQQTQ